MRRITIAAFAGVAIAGCTDTPSPSIGRSALEERLASSAAKPKLLSFEKSDGQSGEMMGVKMYQMSFSATLENSRNSPEFFSFGEPPSFYCKGDRGTVAGTVMFERSERGWFVTNVLGREALGGLPDYVGKVRHHPCDGVPASSNERPRETGNQPSARSRDPSSDSRNASACDTSHGIDESNSTFIGTKYHTSGTAADQELSFGGWGDLYLDFLRFDIPRKPVKEATLCLFVVTAPPNDPHLIIGMVTEPWEPSALSISNQPAYQGNWGVPAIAGGWIAINVSDIVARWASGQSANNGFVIKPQANNQTNGSFTASRSADAIHRPKLILR